MPKFLPALAVLGLLFPFAAGEAGATPAPKDAYLYIGWPNDGEVVKSPFKVWFGLRNMGVAPAGIDKPDTGHHHLLINADLPPMNEPIPNNRTHLHSAAGRRRQCSTCRPASTRCS